MRYPGRTALLCLLGALLCYLAVHWLNRPAVWRPVVIETLARDVTASAPVAANTSYEISLEVDRALARTSAMAIAAPAPQSLVTGRWTLSCADATMASGDVASYLRIRGPQSWRGEVFRIVTRVPFGLDEAAYRTFGVSGRFLTERVVGRFDSGPVVSEPCSLQWQDGRSTVAARLALRKSLGDWETHFRRATFLLIGVPVLGLLGLVAGWRWYRGR